jgi:hypothetical protein
MRVRAGEFRACAHICGGFSCAGASRGDSAGPNFANVDLDEIRHVACRDKVPDTALR